MAKIDVVQTSFVGGEFAPSLFGRTDIAQYSNACAIVENFLIRPYGPLISTPGTEYINACKTGGSTSVARLIHFVFSRTDSFIIEMGVGYFRFYNNGAVVVSPGTTPYEISHTYTASELDEVQYAQVNDVIYLTHKSHPPAKLTRLSSTNWTLTNLSFTGGPFTPDNVIYSGGTTNILSSATITPSATSGSITLSASANIFIASSSTLGHINTYWKVNSTITDSTTGLSVQGFVQITAITNPSTATATVIKTLKSTAATTTWAQGSWSDVLGWPARVTFHEQSLCLARTNFQPLNVWKSQPFTYENFAVNAGGDDDAIDVQLASTESNEIKWLVSGDSLIAGSYGGDFIIGTGDGSPLTPSNVKATKQSSWGSEPVPPKRIGNYFYYIQRFARKLRELFYFWDLNSYKSLDKTILSPHIAGTGFKEFCYQQNPDNIIWAVCSDGTLATLTREIDQEVQGWSRQTTDGSYESIASIPSQDNPHDEVWVIVKRNINGSDVRYIERFKSQIVPDKQSNCFYVHSGLSYDAFYATSAPTATSMSFTYPNSTTRLLLHADESPLIDSAQSNSISSLNNAQLSTSTKKFGAGSLYLPNVLGVDSYTKLLLHMDNNVTDYSSSAKTVTNSSVVFSSSIKKFGGYSAVFNGVFSYLTVADSADWNLGTGDFTFDFWVRYQSLSGLQGIYSQYIDADNYLIIYKTTGQGLTLVLRSSGVNYTISSLSPVFDSTEIFYHVAIVRNGTSGKIYINGSSVGVTNTLLGTSIPDFAAPIFIGAESAFGGYLNGYLDEFRISKGIARWTANFTPPEYAYTDLFDYVSVPDSNDWSFGTGDFTIDTWVSFNNLTELQYIAGQYADADNYWYIAKDTNSNGNKLKYFARSGAATKANYTMTSTWSSVAINTFYHMAVIRSSSTLLIAINGTSQALTATTPISTNDVGNVSAPLIIGQQNSSGGLNGYIDEFRVVKGTPIWTGSFTVPTSEHTLSGTVALVTSSSAYFSAGNVGKRIRATDSAGVVVGEMTITGYTSSTIVVGTITQDMDSFSYASGRWGISASSISGLNHLEGEIVSVLADGIRDTPNKTVSNGTITLSSDYFYVSAGKPYTQIFKSLPQEAGSQRGTAQGKLQRINQIGIKVNNSYDGFQIGPDEDSLDTLTQSSPSLYTGTIANVLFRGGYEYGATVLLENPDPLPIELLALIVTLDTQDK